MRWNTFSGISFFNYSSDDTLRRQVDRGKFHFLILILIRSNYSVIADEIVLLSIILSEESVSIFWNLWNGIYIVHFKSLSNPLSLISTLRCVYIYISNITILPIKYFNDSQSALVQVHCANKRFSST